MRKRILVVDDDPSDLDVIAESLEREGYDVAKAESGKEALRLIESENFNLIITDLKLPDIDGMEILRRAKAEIPHVQVIVLTGYGTIEGAVEAMRSGAFHFLQKPVDIVILRETVKRALEKQELELRNIYLMEQAQERYRFENLIGKSKAMQEIFRQVDKAAKSKITVLITGESGTGKELIAGLLHELSPRKDKPYVIVDLAAISKDLLETELFGIEKKVATGVAARAGVFERANGGTIFLDEIGDMPLETQMKVLRVLAEQEFTRVGGTKVIKVDVRVISATNKNLKELMEKGVFRHDLYYRLNAMQIHLPALRERLEDLPALVAYFLRKYATQNAKPSMEIGPEAFEVLRSYWWPGNVRELEKCIEHAVVVAEGRLIRIEHLPREIVDSVRLAEAASKVRSSGHASLPEAVEALEKQMIIDALRRSGNVKTRAARLLGIHESTLRKKLKAYGIEV